MKDYAGMFLYCQKLFLCVFHFLNYHVGVSPMMFLIPLGFNA
jgi:hypothetical protein